MPDSFRHSRLVGASPQHLIVNVVTSATLTSSSSEGLQEVISV